MQIQSPKD